MTRTNPKDWYEGYAERVFSTAGFPARIRHRDGGAFARDIIEYDPSRDANWFVYYDDGWEPYLEEDAAGHEPFTPLYTVRVKGGRYSLDADWERLQRGVYVETQKNILRNMTAAEIVDYIRNATPPWEEEL